MGAEIEMHDDELIQIIKRVLKIIAKVIRDKNPSEVIKEIDPCEVINNKIIADIINETNFLQRIKDYEPDAVNAENDLAILTDDLTTEIRNNQPKIDINDDAISNIIGTLSDAIREKLTPDLPGLNPKEENAIIGQLGPSLFIYFLRAHRYQQLKKEK